MELSINKSLPGAGGQTLRQTAAPAEEAAALEQFSLILDQAVSETQEKTTAADKAPEAPLERETGQSRRAVGTELDAAREAGRTAVLSFPQVEQKSASKSPAGHAEAPEQEEADALEIKPDAVPGGTFQTQLQQNIEKALLRGGAAERIELPEREQQSGRTAETPGFRAFEEIYAEVLREMRAGRQDGKILKLKFTLEPETLGKLDLYVLADKKNLQLVFAAGEDTRKILQAAQGELKDILESFGCSLADLGFSSYAGAKHQELEAQFLAQETGQREYDILKIIQKKDIITEVRHLLRDMLVNYLA